MTGPPTTPRPDRTPSAASRRWAQGSPRDDTIATKRRKHRPRAPLTPAERELLAELLQDRRPWDQQPTRCPAQPDQDSTQ